MKQATRPQDVAQAFLRAVSPFLATCPGTHGGHTNTDSTPPARPAQRQQENETTRKACEYDAFMPPTHPAASKKVIENKDTIRLTSATSPPKPPKSPISAKSCHSLPFCKEILYFISQQL